MRCLLEGDVLFNNPSLETESTSLIVKIISTGDTLGAENVPLCEPPLP